MLIVKMAVLMSEYYVCVHMIQLQPRQFCVYRYVEDKKCVTKPWLHMFLTKRYQVY